MDDFRFETVPLTGHAGLGREWELEEEGEEERRRVTWARQPRPRPPAHHLRRPPAFRPRPLRVLPVAASRLIADPPSTGMGSAQPASEQGRWVQSCLNHAMGFNLPITGVIDAATRSALRSFQKKEALPVDGIAGPPTRDALAIACGKQSAPANGTQAGAPAAATQVGAPEEELAGTSPPRGCRARIGTGEAEFPHKMEDMDMQRLVEFETLPFDLEEEGVLDETDFMFEAYEDEAEFETAAPGRTNLLRIIPDRPDFHRFVPLEYRLDAKEIVGKLRQDLEELKSPSANDLRKTAGDILKFVAGTSIKAPVKILIDTLKNIPGGYLALAANLARKWAASGFSRGVVMGADGRSKSDMLQLFGRKDAIVADEQKMFPHGLKVAIANYSAGLLAGYIQGRSLSKQQREIFWRDLGYRMGDQSFRGPKERWNRVDWIDWYTKVAAEFSRSHLK